MNTKNYDNFINKATKVHNGRYDYSRVRYKNSYTKVEIVCPKHGSFLQMPSTHVNGAGCPMCGREASAEKHRVPVVSFEEFVNRANEIHNGKYDYTLAKEEYRNTKIKIPIICPVHGVFYQAPSEHMHGDGCKKCADKRNADARRITKEEFLLRAREVHGWKYDYSKVDLKDPSGKITIICPVHGEFQQLWGNHIGQKQGCPICGKNKHTDHFLEAARKKFGDRFDYSHVLVGQTPPGSKELIVCSKHGAFMATRKVHLNTESGGCKECARELRERDFLKKAKIIHGDKYDYSRVHYVNNRTKVEIICPVHGSFMQNPDNHTGQNQGCPKCGDEYRGRLNLIPKDEFIRRVIETCGPYLDFSESEYVGLNKDITVRCKKHGLFTKLAQSLTRGHGCPKCSYENKSLINRLLSDEQFLQTVPSNSLLEIIGNNHGIPRALRDLLYTQCKTEARSNAIRRLKEAMGSASGDENDDFLQNSDIENDTLYSLAETNAETETDIESGTAIDAINALGWRKNKEGIVTEFIRQEYLHGLWNDILNGRVEVKDIQIEKTESGVSETLFSEFLDEYGKVAAVDPGPDYRFPSPLTLLQKLVVKRSIERTAYANWSAMGSGKTLAALVSARMSGCRKILVLAPKDVLVHSWAEQIRSAYPDTTIFTNIPEIRRNIEVLPLDTKTSGLIDGRSFNCILVNYDRFSTPEGYEKLGGLLLSIRPDFVCLDEIQYVKTSMRNDASNRHVFTADFVRKLRDASPMVRVHVLSGTPVINDVQEPRSILSILTGKELSGTNRVSVKNVHELYGGFLVNGFRFTGETDKNIEVNLPEVNADDILKEIASIKPDEGLLPLERVLVRRKIQSTAFLGSLRKGTIIFSLYVDGIVDAIVEAVRKEGYSVETYIGETEDRSGAFTRFVNGETDILVASRPLVLGVDGLQERSNNMIILSLPWTWAEYQQLVARINRPRKNGNDTTVTVTIPQVTVRTKNGTWSWDRRRYAVIRNKKTLGEAIVDGYIERIYAIDREKLLRETIESINEIS